MRLFLILVAWLIATGESAIAQQSRGQPWFSAARCSTQDAMDADNSLDGLTDWSAVHRAFKLYGKCDDGAIAEGYSDAVSKLLARHWETLPEFAKLARAHPRFEQFVFWHVDETWNLEDANAVVENARNRCPGDLRALCRRLEKAARPFK